MKLDRPIQDFYPDEIAVCYGCGRNNPKGLHLKTYWDGTEGICHFTPHEEHTAYPGIVYGGLIASLIDCHSIGTATAAMYEAEGYLPGDGPQILCVTGKLDISYLKPTPMGVELTLRAKPVEVTGRKAIIACSLYAEDVGCAQAELIAIRSKARGDEGGHHGLPT